MWSEAGKIQQFSAQQRLPGMSFTLIGQMATISNLTTASPISTNMKVGVHLGGMTHSILQNNTMPELGVSLGLHRTNHSIYLLECESVTMEDSYDQNKSDQDPLQIDLNNISSMPKSIYTYRGFASSPHRVSFCKDGSLLIPTDIGILQYDILNGTVVGEWLNPTLIPFVRDHIEVKGKGDISIYTTTTIGSMLPLDDQEPALYVSLDISKNIIKNHNTYQKGKGSLLTVKADKVYESASNIGSYGQITYENSDFSEDRIVLLDRST